MMNCESCKTKKVEIELSKNEGLEGGIWDSHIDEQPYHLCLECVERLKGFRLRPLEFFNLVAIHGDSFHLHDDFYDYETGEATQPEIEVTDADKFPFPEFEEIKDDLNILIDFAFVQYFTEDFVLQQLQKFDSAEVLKRIEEKVNYNRGINYKAYEIAAKVNGRTAEVWIKKEWANRQESELHLFAEAIATCLEFEEAFEILTKELESSDDKFLSKKVSALLYLKSAKTLSWIEKNSSRIQTVSPNWGQLAASSQFSWEVANHWLTLGRPLSLIALDALVFCTTTGERRNQGGWMQKLNPSLPDSPGSEIITSSLKNYLLTDSVPRTKTAVKSILKNLSQVNKQQNSNR